MHWISLKYRALHLSIAAAIYVYLRDSIIAECVFWTDVCYTYKDTPVTS